MQGLDVSQYANESYELWPAMAVLDSQIAAPVVVSVSDDDCAYHNVATCPDCGGGLLRMGNCCTCPSCGLEACGI